MAKELTTKAQIEQALEEIKGLRFNYFKKEQYIVSWKIEEGKERVIIYTNLKEPIRRVYEDVHLFINRVYEDVEKRAAAQEEPATTATTTLSAPVATTDALPSADVQAVIGFMGNNDPIHKVHASLLDELEKLGTATPQDYERIRAKIDIADVITKGEIAKANKVNALVKLAGKR